MALLFASAVAYPAAGTPRWVACADTRGVGKIDIATANGGSDNISVLLGNGDGTFGAHTEYTTGGGAFPLAVAFGSTRGNGVLDLVAANNGTGTISVLLGHGDGTFAGHVDYPTGDSDIRNITLASTRGNGVLDVLVASGSDNRVTVLLGNGNGTFGAPVHYSTGAGSNPQDVSVGSLRHNGVVDLVVPSYGTNMVSVLLGHGDGTFAAHADYPSGGLNPQPLGLADTRNIGRLDIVVPNGSSSNVAVLLGNGDGTFGAPVTYATGVSPAVATLADLRGIDRFDIVAMNFTGGGFSILLGNGDGTFAARTDYAGPPSFYGVLADTRGNGRLDVVTANLGGGTAAVYLQQQPAGAVHGEMGIPGTASIVRGESGAGSLVHGES